MSNIRDLLSTLRESISRMGNIFINGTQMTDETGQTVNIDDMTIVRNVNSGVTVTRNSITRRSGKRTMRSKTNHRQANIAAEDLGSSEDIDERGRSHSELTENSNEETCIICLSNFTDNRKKYFLPCGHYFHEDCMHIWVRRSKTCPVCRLRLRDV